MFSWNKECEINNKSLYTDTGQVNVFRTFQDFYLMGQAYCIDMLSLRLNDCIFCLKKSEKCQ